MVSTEFGALGPQLDSCLKQNQPSSLLTVQRRQLIDGETTKIKLAHPIRAELIVFHFYPFWDLVYKGWQAGDYFRRTGMVTTKLGEEAYLHNFTWNSACSFQPIHESHNFSKWLQPEQKRDFEFSFCFCWWQCWQKSQRNKSHTWLIDLSKCLFVCLYWIRHWPHAI